jgi:hypothetical protein
VKAFSGNGWMNAEQLEIEHLHRENVKLQQSATF